MSSRELWRGAVVVGLVVATGLLSGSASAQRAPTGGAPPPGQGPYDLRGPVRVIDGNTLETYINGKLVGVRLAGIDAPEGNTDCGRAATAQLRELVRGGVRFEDEPGQEQDDRKLRVFRGKTLDGRSIGPELARAGVARAVNSGQEAATISAAEQEARGRKEGCLWSGSDAQSLGQPGDGAMLLSKLALGAPGGQDDVAAPAARTAPPVAAPVRTVASAAVPTDFVEDVVAAGFTNPTNFAFLPDGRILVTEKAGLVRVIKNGQLLATPFIDVRSRVNDYWDHGLLGIAPDKDFATNGQVYLLYTYENNAAQYDGTKTSRLARYTATSPTADTAPLSSEQVILGTMVGVTCKALAAGADCIPSDGPSHSIGTVQAAADGTLFLTVGDASSFNFVDDDALRAQDLNSLAGKVLHINRDGTGVAGNPFMTTPGANRSKVWAYGLRNSYRFSLRPGSGMPYSGDVGWDNTEEINVSAKGANQGWPCYEGPVRQAGYEPKPACQTLYGQGTGAVRMPLTSWDHAGNGAASTGGVFYTGTSFPAALQGAYFYGDYARSTLSYLTVNASDGLTSGPTDFASGANGPVAIGMGPDGNLYYVAINTGQLLRIRYVASAPLNCSNGQYAAEYFANQTLSGTATFRRCEAAPVNYTWPDGTGPGNGVPTDHFSARWTGTFSFTAGTYTFSATADDGIRVWVDGAILIDQWKDQGATTYTAPKTLTAGNHVIKTEYYDNGVDAVAKVSWQGSGPTNQPPVPTITSPSSTTKFKVGDVISFTGSATDPEDGTVPASRLAWQVTIKHCPGGGTQCHDHPLTSATGAGGSFTAPDHEEVFHIDLTLTATDSAGLTGATTISLQPQTSQLTLASVPSGLQLTYNGQSVTAPFVINPIIGGVRTIGAPSPQGGSTFSSWSDSGAQQHNITIGAANATYTATFSGGQPPPTCTTGQYQAEYFANQTLSGAATFQRCEAPPINYTWPDGTGPGNGVPTDHFSVRWTGTFSFTAGTYTFSATADDGIRVWVDGAILIDQWKDQGATTYTAPKTLTAGNHVVKVEYYDNAIDAVAKVSWQGGGQPPPTCTTGQYQAEYFANQTLSGAATFQRCEAAPINYTWPNGTGPGNGIPMDHFSVRWTGTFSFTAKTYTFSATADDGIRVWVDGAILIDQWKDQGATTYTATKALTAGNHVVKVEFYDNAIDAVAKVSWN